VPGLPTSVANEVYRSLREARGAVVGHWITPLERRSLTEGSRFKLAILLAVITPGIGMGLLMVPTLGGVYVMLGFLITSYLWWKESLRKGKREEWRVEPLLALFKFAFLGTSIMFWFLSLPIYLLARKEEDGKSAWSKLSLGGRWGVVLAGLTIGALVAGLVAPPPGAGYTIWVEWRLDTSDEYCAVTECMFPLKGKAKFEEDISSLEFWVECEDKFYFQRREFRLLGTWRHRIRIENAKAGQTYEFTETPSDFSSLLVSFEQLPDLDCELIEVKLDGEEIPLEKVKHDDGGLSGSFGLKLTERSE